MENAQALDSWIEWQQRCALGLCSPASQGVLREFAAVRFAAHLRKYAFRTNANPQRLMVEATEAWHLFETHLELKHCRGGKRYKDWLFARAETGAGPDLPAVEGGATLLLRDVVREYLRQECSSARLLPLDQPVGASADSPTLAELLPGGLDPAGEAERREFARLAQQSAAKFLGELRERERIALLAKQLGLSLAHSEVQRAAGCGKSMVNQAYRDVVQRVCARLQADYADDDREAVLTLALMTLEEIHRALLLWAKSENRCAALFLIREQLRMER